MSECGRTIDPPVTSAVTSSGYLQLSRTSTASSAVNFGTIGLQSVGNITRNITATSITLTDLNPSSKYLVSLNWLLGAGAGTSGAYVSITVGTATNSLTSAAGILNSLNVIRNPVPYNQATTLLYVYVVTPSAGGVITIDSTGNVMIASTTFGFDAFIVQLG